MSEALNLIDLAGLDVSAIEEVRSSILPAGAMIFTVKDASMEEASYTDKRTQEEVHGIRIKMEFEVVQAHAVPGLSEEELAALAGRIQSESAFVTKEHLPKDVGRVKALIADTGFTASGTFQDMLESWKGHYFGGRIVHKKNPNDKDQVFANLSRNQKHFFQVNVG